MPAVSAPTLVDGAGGTVSRIIEAAGTVYNEASENRERSSFVDAFLGLRSRVVAARATRGGGYRPVSGITPLGPSTLDPWYTGATIGPAQAVTHGRDNENTYRANLGEAVDALLVDLAAGGVTAPAPAAFTRLTDNSGGTPSTELATAGTSYNQGGENNMRATIALKLNQIADAIGA